MKTPIIAVLRSNPKDAALSRLVKSLSQIARVDCFVWDRQGDFMPTVTDGRIRYFKCGIRAGYYNLGTFLKLLLFQVWLFCRLIFLRCDVIHAIDLDTGLPGWLAAQLRGKRFVYHCLDPYYAILPESWPRFLANGARRLENFLITQSHLFIITDLLRLPQHTGAKPQKIVEVANVPIIPAAAASVPAVNGSFTVGYLGSLIEGRNLLTVIDACGELQQQGIRLTIGGFGPLEKRIESHAANRSNITFRNWQPYEKMLEEESTFDLFLHITDPDNQAQKWVSPNKLFEAMAFGKPIIVGGNTLAAKRVELFGNGVAVTYGSKQEFQEAILRFKNAPDLSRQMGEKGFLEFERNWRPEIIEKRLLDNYPISN